LIILIGSERYLTTEITKFYTEDTEENSALFVSYSVFFVGSLLCTLWLILAP
jgi:hypothetical protein